MSRAKAHSPSRLGRPNQSAHRPNRALKRPTPRPIVCHPVS
jgi:hypothetical protein